MRHNANSAYGQDADPSRRDDADLLISWIEVCLARSGKKQWQLAAAIGTHASTITRMLQDRKASDKLLTAETIRKVGDFLADPILVTYAEARAVIECATTAQSIANTKLVAAFAEEVRARHQIAAALEFVTASSKDTPPDATSQASQA